MCVGYTVVVRYTGSMCNGSGEAEYIVHAASAVYDHNVGT